MVTGTTAHQYEGRPTSFVMAVVVEQIEEVEELRLAVREMTGRLGGQPRERLIVAPR
jgi:uncharacterized membrane protein YoaK (UPF0700 family)